jgi:beta-lactamase class A
VTTASDSGYFGDDPRLAAVRTLLRTFIGDDDGRSVAVMFPAREGDGNITLHENGEAVRPVASVIKVALVMALYDLAQDGRVALGEQVPLNALGETRYCSIMKAFDAGRSLSLGELAALALITSDNPVAVLLEDRVGRDAVGAVLARAGIAAERAQMRVGFREDELGPKNRANALSALDVLRLFELLRSEPRYGPIVVALENNLRNARIPALLPDEAVIAHKTGTLNGVANDAGIVRLGTDAFTVAFLCDGQDDPAVTGQAIAECAKGLFEVVLGDG